MHTPNPPAVVTVAGHPRTIELWDEVVAAAVEMTHLDTMGAGATKRARQLQHEQVVAYQQLLDTMGIELWSVEDLDLLDHLGCICAASTADDAVDTAA